MGDAKLIYLAKRSAPLSKEAFPARWKQHSALPRNDPQRVLEVETVTYAQIDAVACGGADDDYDAIGLIELAGLQSIPAAARSLTARGDIAADELLTFADHIEPSTIFCSAEVLFDGPICTTSLIQFVRRAANLRPTPFVEAWRAAALAALTDPQLAPRLRRLVQNVVVAPPPSGRAYDGVLEVWFDDRDAALASVASLACDPNVVDVAASPMFLTTTVMHRAGRPPSG